MRKLLIYYDNPNEASDMYLKWLKKDCENKGVNYCVVENFDALSEEFNRDSTAKILPMLPVEDERIIGFLRMYNWTDIDNVTKTGLYTSATAQGIFNHIVKTHPDRETSIAVIGRGVVGKELLDLLINYGYTVYEFNSKSRKDEMFDICKVWADIVVGLATTEIFGYEESRSLVIFGAELIDAGNCFHTTNKLRCGKWTREVLLSRLED